MRTVESVTIYAAQVQGEETKMHKYQIRIAAIQIPGALGITTAYHTVSEPAGIVLTGLVPIDLKAQERREALRSHTQNAEHVFEWELYMSGKEVMQEAIGHLADFGND